MKSVLMRSPWDFVINSNGCNNPANTWRNRVTDAITEMKVVSRLLDIQSNEQLQYFDVTPQVRAIIEEAGIVDGFAIVSSRHTTTALFINEYEQRLLQDMKDFLRRTVPVDNVYLHNDIHLRDCPPEEPENAHSHIMAMLMSSSEAIPVIDGALSIGQWQSLIFVELDGPRRRSLTVQLIGNTAKS
jgi:secondary thiamine-phosphate synthase enzyme